MGSNEANHAILAVHPSRGKRNSKDLAASLGLEPRQRDPESLVLPLHYEAKMGPNLKPGLVNSQAALATAPPVPARLRFSNYLPSTHRLRESLLDARRSSVSSKRCVFRLK